MISQRACRQHLPAIAADMAPGKGPFMLKAAEEVLELERSFAGTCERCDAYASWRLTRRLRGKSEGRPTPA